MLATYKLSNEESTATGFVLEAEDGRRFLVTSAHVLEKMAGETAVLVSRTEKDGEYFRKDVKLAVRDGKKPLWVKHLKQDVAVMELELPEDSGVQALPVSVLATDDLAQSSGYTVGSGVVVLGFPTRFEVNGAGFPVARRGGVASFPVIPMAKNPTVIVDFTTFEGDSGGPVFMRLNGGNGKPLLVGLVVSQFRHTEKLKTFTGTQTIHHSLGLSTVVQAEAIRETLELAAKKEGEVDGDGGEKEG